MNLIHLLLCAFCASVVTSAQREFTSNGKTGELNEKLIWCTISEEELKKCELWSQAIHDSRSDDFKFELGCKQAADKDQCMNLIENENAHLLSLDPGEVYVAGRYHSLVPILYERYNDKKEEGYYSVAVVKTESASYIRDIRDLKDRKACFTGVGHMAGWVIPMATLIEEYNLVDIYDCNNVIKTAANFFNESCAPNSLIDKNNPIGDNPQSMCALCYAGNDKRGLRCSGSDPYANFDGAFQCLSRWGDIAFLKHTTVDQMTRRRTSTTLSKHQFELLCPNGGRRSVDAYRDCNWGYVPSHAVVISSAILPDKRKQIQQFVIESVKKFGAQSFSNDYTPQRTTTTFRPYSPYNSFNQTINNYARFNGQQSNFYNLRDKFNATFSLFGNPSGFGGYNLLFSDETTDLSALSENRQTFAGYLGYHSVTPRYGSRSIAANFLNYFEKLRKCPIPNAKFCVVSEMEMEKCNDMRRAFRSQMLKPELTCVRGYSAIECLSMIRDGTADLTVLDAGDIYTGGHKFNAEPIIAEQYNLNETFYYVVAIARQSDKNTDLLYLKGKRSCHTGFGLASGWVIPLSFLLSNARMRSYGCDAARAASEFFQKSCVPGALSREFYGIRTAWDYGNLCDLCHGASFRFCRRDSSEPFFGDTGAMRCLVEGGGEIAFARHTTILQNTAGRNAQWWARNVIPEDFELLCRDGTRDHHSQYKRCHLARVAANAIVTNRYKDEYQKEAYINLFLYAQQFYGSKYSEDFTFKMFVSEDGHHDLIFQDATQQLKAIPAERRDYKRYLGHDFLKAMTIVDCTAAAFTFRPSNLIFIFIFVSVSAIKLYDKF